MDKRILTVFFVIYFFFISFEEGDGIVKFTAGGGAAPDVYLVFSNKIEFKMQNYKK